MGNNRMSFPPVGASTTAATQAEMESASSTTTMSTPGRQNFHPGHCKAWVSIDGTGTVTMLGSYNVSSITDNNVGDFTVNFTVAFSDTHYAMASHRVIASAIPFLSYHTSGANKSTTSCRIASFDSSILGDVGMNDVAFFGDQ